MLRVYGFLCGVAMFSGAKTNRRPYKHELPAWVLTGIVAGLTGCGGGSDSVGLGGSQDPDPVVVDVPIAYVKVSILDEDGVLVDQDDLREQDDFRPGADLYLRDRASPSSPETNLTESITQGMGDVRDVDVSYDGERLVFALREPEIPGLDEEDQPSWNIWEYDIPSATLRRVIGSDITAEDGDDRMPHYLPDGRIIFTSSRQRRAKARLLDESKPQFGALDENFNEEAFVLHVMEADGSNLRQISFNQSHDLDPVVLSTGQIMFTRWDNAGPNNAMHLYRVNPDGTDLEMLYGANSHATGSAGDIVQFTGSRDMPDGRVAVISRAFTDTDFGGAITFIDVANYLENIQPNADNIGVLTGPAQENGTVNDVRTEVLLSPGGRFSSVFPLWDGTDRMFVSWSQCRMAEPDGTVVPCTDDSMNDPANVPANPLYGIWLYDTTDDTQLPVFAPEEDFMFTDVVAGQVRARPTVISDLQPGVDADAALGSEGVGLIDIRSVYDIDGVDTATPDIATLADPAATLAADRPARFLRVEKAVGIPDDEVFDFSNTAFGVTAAFGMREIVAYAPVEPDGSVVMKVPADMPLALTFLDEDGRRISPRHNNWLQVAPGQVLSCNGCHAPNTGESHGRQDAFNRAWDGADADGVPFPNTNSALFADFEETMAQVRYRLTCATDCSSIQPSLDLVYEDVWTDEVAAGRPADAPFTDAYTDLLTPAPTTAACQTTWASDCRILINYEDHIHPLWELDRRIFDVDGVTVLEDRTCIACHSPVDDMGMTRVPEGQLDLSGDPSTDEPEHLVSYRELMFSDDEQELNGGALQDVLVQVGTDPVTGDPIFATVNVPASMSAGSANFSDAFLARFETGGSHDGYLSDAELKLVSEWLDIGGQYFNNPFDAPLD